MSQPQYKTWKDKGGNIGIQCGVCGKTHWTGKESTIDPTTGKPCDNCEGIKEMDVLKSETEVHRNHPEEECTHQSSQP